MSKREVKASLKSIKKNIDNYDFSDLERSESIIVTAIESLQSAFDETGVDVEIDTDELLSNAMHSLIENDDTYIDIIADLDYCLADIDEWIENSSERKSEEIEYDFLEPVQDIKCELEDISEIYNLDEFKDMLSNSMENIDEILDR